MRRVLAVLTLVVVAALPSRAAAGGLDLRIGGFFRAEKGTLFEDVRDLYTADKGDFKGLYGGVEYSFGLGEKLELGLHVDGYGRTRSTSYRDFTRPSGREITQTSSCKRSPVGMTLRFVPRPGRGEVTPYFGVGADLVSWQYEEIGDFIDFEDDGLPVIADHFLADGTAPGFHAVAGVRVPLGYDFSIVARRALPLGEGRHGRRLRQLHRPRQARPLRALGYARREHPLLAATAPVRGAPVRSRGRPALRPSSRRGLLSRRVPASVPIDLGLVVVTTVAGRGGAARQRAPAALRHARARPAAGAAARLPAALAGAAGASPTWWRCCWRWPSGHLAARSALRAPPHPAHPRRAAVGAHPGLLPGGGGRLHRAVPAAPRWAWRPRPCS